MKMRSIREAYGKALEKLGAENPNVVVLEADVGSSTQSKIFGASHPERYFNMGIAEIGMVSAAAGMACCGKIPFVNTFSTFMATRAGDPVQSLIAYDRLNVKLAGAYSGLSDSYDGASHHSITDIAFMRALPNMVVLCPCDAVETEKAVFTAAAHEGPVFLRLSRAEAPVVFDDEMPCEIGKAVIFREGRDLTIVSTGTETHHALAAADELLANGVSVEVLHMASVKPLDIDALVRSAKKTGHVLVAEEHSVYGGLGSAVAEALALACPVPMAFVGVRAFAESGDYSELLKKYELDSTAIRTSAIELLKRTH